MHQTFAQHSNQDSSEAVIRLNERILDSLKSTYTALSDSVRIKKIISDSRALGYFYPDEIMSLIDNALLEVRKKGNKRAEIDLLFQKGYIITDAYSDLEGSRIVLLHVGPAAGYG